MTNKTTLKNQGLIENPTTRVPVCLCLDTSGSMSGKAIDELNEGVRHFFEELMQDDVARYAAEICIVTFGGTAACVEDFGDLERQNRSRTFLASGETPMGEALKLALSKLEKRKQEYQKVGVDYFQPWLVIMTDGQPKGGDEAVLEAAIQKAAEMQRQKKLVIFAIGIGEKADMDVLRRISPDRQPLKLRDLKFIEFFLWLSRSVSVISQSIPGVKTPLDTDAIRDWATL
jgi:uncharacterized protein YegL